MPVARAASKTAGLPVVKMPNWKDPQSIATYVVMAAGVVCLILHVTQPSWMGQAAQAVGLLVAAGAGLYNLWRHHSAKALAITTGAATLER